MSWLNHHFLDMNVVTDADRKKQDEWGSQWASLDQAHSAVLPEVPITLITAMQSGGPLLQRLLPVWLQSHSNWLSQFPDARHIITTNSGHGIFFTEPDLVVKAVEEMLREGDARK